MPTAKNILCVDITTYRVALPRSYHSLKQKIHILQTAAWQGRVGKKLIRPAYAYSRGFLTITATLLRKGFNVKYLVFSDLQDRAQIKQYAQEADVICISAVTPTIQLASAICNLAKKVNPKILTVVGGAHVTELPLDSLWEFEGIDVLLTGECDDRLPEFLGNTHDFQTIGGLFYRDPGNRAEILQTVAMVEEVVVPDLPMPAYNLLSRPLSAYSHNIQTSRGCPYPCHFCADRATRKATVQSEANIPQIFQEIKFLSDKLPSQTLVHFSDAIFNLKQDRTGEILGQLKHLKSHLLFSFDTRVNLIEKNKVKEFLDAGMVFIRLGFETKNEQVLGLNSKNINYQDQLNVVEDIRSVSKNIAILAYFICGLPGSTHESLREDAEYIYRGITHKLFDIVSNKVFVPYPGTPFYQDSARYGLRISSRNWRKYDRNSFPVYDLEELSAQQIYAGFINQEQMLEKGYSDLLGISDNNLQGLEAAHDFVYQNYVRFA